MKVEKVTKFFMRRPTLFWSLVVGIVVAGVISFIKMPKLEDPAVSAKQAMVVVVYPGATAHEVELNVAQTMEDKLRTLPDVYEIRTDCQEGMAKITVEFEMTVLNKDLEEHFDLLRRKVNDIKSSLPQGCYDPMVIDDMMDVYGIFYALKSDGYDYSQMEKYAKLIQRDLLTVKGVKRVNIVGTRREVINITLSKEKLSRNGILPTQIMMQLQADDKTVNAGKYETNGDRIQLRVNKPLSTAEDISNIQIKTATGKQMRIGDIADVKQTYAEPQTNGFFVNGTPSLAICVAMQNGVIVPDVGKAVDKQLDSTMKRIPAGLSTEKIFFQPDKVNEAINSFLLNLIESVLIVIIVLIFTMGIRSGLIIGSGLILTICVSFPILLSMGSTLQRISLGAFIIAMGMLVDNSIVIMDGILIDRKKGLPPKKYLFRIGNNTALPLLGATVIAATTFISVYMSPDSAGEYCRDMFLVLCVSLLSSWVLALIQVPIFAKVMLPAREKLQNNSSQTVLNSPLHRFVRRVINFLMGYKRITVAVAVGVLALSIFGMTKVKNVFFPDFDYKQFVVEYQLPDQTSPDRVRHDLLEMTALLKKNPQIERVAASMGSAPAHYCLVRPMTDGGDGYGELIVDCKDFETVQNIIPALRKQLREKYPDAYIRIRKYNFSISTSHTVEVQFHGPDPKVLRSLSAQAEDIMRQSKYVDTYSVENNWKPQGKAIVADFVEQNALRAGVSRANVADALLAATDGLPVGVVNNNGKSIVVNMLVRNQDNSKIKDLRDAPMWSATNVNINSNDVAAVMNGSKNISDIQEGMFQSTPMSAVTNGMNISWEEDFVHRVNGQRTIEAKCDPNTDLYEGTTAKVRADISKKIEQIPLPDGYTMSWAGESKTQSEATKNVLGFLPLTMFIILGILLLLFNSWKKMFIILACLPFVFCGITPGLLVLHKPFTFMAIIGLIGLIGMMIKNSIVLVDEINRLITEENYQPYNAVVAATVSRVRPVTMASLTTIVGMIPLLGDPMYGSMAIIIMSGLTVGTIITLILLPVVYAALFHIHKPHATQQQLTLKEK